jgi:hypothetical protein
MDRVRATLGSNFMTLHPFYTFRRDASYGTFNQIFLVYSTSVDMNNFIMSYLSPRWMALAWITA